MMKFKKERLVEPKVLPEPTLSKRSKDVKGKKDY